MEIQRLKTMSDYDPRTFNELYKKTRQLRRKLAKQIDHRRFGVTPDIIESWFDDKFIMVFNKYIEYDKEILLGHIINSLQTFKYRILRNAYTNKNEFYNNFISIPDSSDDDHDSFLARIPDSSEPSYHEVFMGLVEEFMVKNLTDDARLVWEIEMNPPLFILDKIKKSNSRIPAKLIAEYLELEVNKQSIRFINSVRSEIKEVVEKAKEVFNNVTLELA